MFQTFREKWHRVFFCIRRSFTSTGGSSSSSGVYSTLWSINVWQEIIIVSYLYYVKFMHDHHCHWCFKIANFMAMVFYFIIVLFQFHQSLPDYVSTRCCCYCCCYLPAGAVPKYCDEHVCLSVCLSVCEIISLSARLFPQPHTRSLPIFLCMLPMAVAQSSSGRVTKSQREGAVLGGFLPHCQCIVQRSIWDPYKNGWTDRDATWDDDSGRPYVPLLDGGPNPPKGRGNFGGKT